MPKYKALLPLMMISHEFNLLFVLPQSENVYKLKRNDQYRKAPGPVRRLEIQREQWQKTQKWNQPLKFPFLEFSTQGTVLINGRKSINPTILSIQIRSKLQI